MATMEVIAIPLHVVNRQERRKERMMVAVIRQCVEVPVTNADRSLFTEGDLCRCTSRNGH